MSQVQRAQIHKSAEIPAPAHEVWMLLTDWAGMLRWSISAKRGGPVGTLIECELIGKPDQVPSRNQDKNADMVERQIVARGITTPAVIKAMKQPTARRLCPTTVSLRPMKITQSRSCRVRPCLNPISLL